MTNRVQAQILINEVYPNPPGSSEEDEWVELFNSTETEVTLSGWKLDDTDGGSKPYLIPTATISAYGYLVIEKSQSKIALNNSGDEVRLFDHDDAIVSNMIIGETDEGVSWGLASGNESEWVRLSEPTKGRVNATPPSPTVMPPTTTPTVTDTHLKTDPVILKAEDVVLSEIYPCPDKDGHEWLELKLKTLNGTLEGWKVRNGREFERELKNTDVSEFAVILFSNHGFSNQGDTIKLISPQHEVVEEMSYSTCSPSTSWSKDDNTWKETVQITRGQMNIISPPPSPTLKLSKSSPTLATVPTPILTIVAAPPITNGEYFPTGDLKVDGGVLGASTSGEQATYLIAPTPEPEKNNPEQTKKNRFTLSYFMSGFFFITAAVVYSLKASGRFEFLLPFFNHP